jgi:MFS family permease
LDFMKFKRMRSERISLHKSAGSVPNYSASAEAPVKPVLRLVVAADDAKEVPDHLSDSSQIPLDQVEAKPEVTASPPESPYSVLKTYNVVRRMPWPIVPFVIGVFIIVQALSVVGFTELLADLLGHRMIGPTNSSSSIMTASVVLTLVTSLVCNLLNNQPMTILFTKVLDEPAFLSVGPSAYLASTFAIIMGSNLGGNMTLVGALAGIMWSSILANKGIPISALQFAKYGFFVMIPVAIVGSVVLGLEHVILRPDPTRASAR